MTQKFRQTLNNSPKVRLLPAALDALAGGRCVAVLIEVTSVVALCQSISKSDLSALQSSATALPSGWKEVPSVLPTAIVRAELGAQQVAALMGMPSVVTVEEDHEITPHSRPDGAR